uniref:Retrovirus-related Pol polyprotein from transposon TNT 1-94 n=1 Tax=Brassica oleracea var. oleracea TaxID=109376 RepID=A0A0D3C9Z6_BRAOL
MLVSKAIRITPVPSLLRGYAKAGVTSLAQGAQRSSNERCHPCVTCSNTTHQTISGTYLSGRHQETLGIKVFKGGQEATDLQESKRQKREKREGGKISSGFVKADLEGQTDPDRADIMWEASSVMKLVVTVFQQCCLECLVNPTMRSSLIELKFVRALCCSLVVVVLVLEIALCSLSLCSVQVVEQGGRGCTHIHLYSEFLSGLRSRGFSFSHRRDSHKVRGNTIATFRCASCPLSPTKWMISLNGANYHLWKGKMEDLLFVKEFHWVDDNVLHHIETETDARSLWKKLEQLYARKTGNNKMYMIKKLIELRYQEETPMTDHLNAFQGLLNKLSDMGIKFDDEIHGLWLLGTLPDSWEVFRMSLCNSASEGVISMDSVKNSVLNEETRRQSNAMKLVVTVFQQCCLECLVNPTVRSSLIELKFGRGVVDWFILDLYGGISLWFPESL